MSIATTSIPFSITIFFFLETGASLLNIERYLFSRNLSYYLSASLNIVKICISTLLCLETMRTAGDFVIDSFGVVNTCTLHCVVIICELWPFFFFTFHRKTKLTIFQMYTYLNYKRALTIAVFFIENQYKIFFIRDLDSCTL